LTVVYSAECKAIQKEDRSGLLPVLVVLFVFSYVILTALVVEQGRTIDAQRGLIREMLSDSNQLAMFKAKAAREEALHRSTGSAQAGSAQNGSAQNGSAQTGSAQTGSAKTDHLGTPLNAPKASGKDGKPAGKSHSMKEAPGRPASDLEDVRRLTNRT
jgi:hypothetical protein